MPELGPVAREALVECERGAGGGDKPLAVLVRCVKFGWGYEFRGALLRSKRGFSLLCCSYHSAHSLLTPPLYPSFRHLFRFPSRVP